MSAEIVMEKPGKTSPKDWRFTPHVAELEASIIREMLKFSSLPGVISFAGGLPAPEMFPLEEMKTSCANIIDRYGSDSMQYSLSMGITPLREAIAARANERGIKSVCANILVTSGAQQALEMVTRVFIDPGDVVITEYPTYVGAIQAFNYHRATYEYVSMDSDGMLVDQLEERIERCNPKLIYIVSTYQNPSGITMALPRRRKLVDIASRHNIPIIDDDPYSELRFEGDPITSLKALGGDIVISLGTFSKLLAPGLRIGWINGPSEIMPLFERVKQVSDLHANTFTQYMVLDFLERGLLDGHIDNIRADYSAKRDLMIKAIKEYFPQSVKITHPAGGLFLWCELPEGCDARELLDYAIEEKVTYVVGKAFHPDGSGENTFRLNFSNASHESIVEGIKRLGRVFGAHLPGGEMSQ
ncbi:MAG: PLP-dependent aminotransferase family protein [candidate division Zixibacteria bacterium]|nr:PLP-dependent aminotransferase family protein [candidate division Zixibacteria bacterium]